MTHSLNILPEEHKPLIREFYKKRLDELMEETNKIQGLLASLDGEIIEPSKTLTFQPTLLSTTPTPLSSLIYNSRWPLIKKAKFAIRQAGKPLTSSQIVEYIIRDCEPALKDDRKRFMSSISGTLSAKSKQPGGIFKRQKNDEEDYEYEIA